ncbi:MULTISPECIES: hypothetical protein [unclassified Paenibacillus]
MEKFTDYSHKNQYRLIKAQLPAGKRNDCNLLPVVYLMAGNEEFRNKVTHFINWNEGEIDWSNLLNSNDDIEELTILIKLSAELYSHKQMISIYDLINKLDKNNFSMVLMLLQNIKEGFHFNTYEIDNLDSYI